MWTSLSEDVWNVESKQRRKNKQGCHAILAGPQLPWLLATSVQAWGILLIPCVIVAFVIWNKSSLFPCGKAAEYQQEKLVQGFFFVFRDGGREVGREGGLWCVAFLCVVLFLFSLHGYRSYIFLERNILSAVLCSEDVNCYFKQQILQLCFTR